MQGKHQPDDPYGLLAAAKSGRIGEWLYQRNRGYEEIYVNRHDLIDRARTWLLVRFVAYGAGIALVTLSEHLWVTIAGILLLTPLGAVGITAPIRRAQAYRNGWLDRSRRDVEVHGTVCLDYHAEVEQFQRAMIAIDAEAMRYA